MVSLLDKFMLTFVEEAESSTDMINHPSQHEKLTLSPMMPLVKATAIKKYKNNCLRLVHIWCESEAILTFVFRSLVASFFQAFPAMGSFE